MLRKAFEADHSIISGKIYSEKKANPRAICMNVATLSKQPMFGKEYVSAM